MRISLCVIARDDPENLAALLEDMRPLVDEFVVVDTGSRDERTLDVAERFGARTGRHEWKDHYALARNAALELATGEWVLSMDPDERLSEVVPGALRQTIEQAAKDADNAQKPVCLCPFLQRAGAAESLGVVALTPRVFPRREDVRWHQPLYEMPQLLSGGTLLLTDMPDVTITHLGHPGDDARAADRQARNRRIIARALEASPEDPLTHMYAGLDHLSRADYEAAVASLEQAVRLAGEPPVYVMANGYLNLVACLRHTGQLDEAIAYGLRGLDYFPRADLDCAVALAYMTRGAPGDEEQALRHLQRARGLHGLTATSLGDRAALTWKPLLALGHIYERHGELERALHTYEDALRYSPSSLTALRSTAAILRKLGRSREAADHLRRAIAAAESNTEPRSAVQDLNIALGEALAEAEAIQEAYDHLAGLVEHEPTVIAYRMSLADFLITAKEHAAAVETLAGALDGAEAAGLPVYQRLGEALTHLGRYEDAANAFRMALSIDPQDQIAQLGLQSIERLAAQSRTGMN